MLEAALVARLSTLAPNLYPLEAPLNYEQPCVVYNRLMTKPVEDLSPIYENAWIYVQVDVYDEDFLTAKQLAEDIRKNLTAWSDQDVQCVKWQDEQDGIDTTTKVTLYRTMLRLVVFANLNP
jgi:hypothetical protein